ncbi:hypothetical protein GMMP15_1030015 [Candidatus Magnetomoraceae bacterium gMMP-15]
MTDIELKELVASLAISQKETSKQLQEIDKIVRELCLIQKKTDKELASSNKEIDRILSELYLSRK